MKGNLEIFLFVLNLHRKHSTVFLFVFIAVDNNIIRLESKTVTTRLTLMGLASREIRAYGNFLNSTLTDAFTG